MKKDLKEALNNNFANMDLRGVDFTGRNLSQANFEGANLEGADLDGASFAQANLTEANLQDTNIITAEFDNTIGVYPVCPTHGSFTGWTIVENEEQEFIAMLNIPAYARRNSGTTRKCRADTAFVVDIRSLEGESVAALTAKLKHRDIKFTIAETIHDNDFETDRFKISSTDLYFYITKEEALAQARKRI